jgi:hypothetical protein
MPRKSVSLLMIVLAVAVARGSTSSSEQRSEAAAAAARRTAMQKDFDGQRPKLAFRAEWKREDAPQHPLAQADLIDERIELKLYGDGKNIVWTQHADEPTYAFTGLCETNCAAAFRAKAGYVDLTGLGRIRMRSKQSGFHVLRPIVKLSDGTWLAADYGISSTSDWIETDIPLADLRWRRLNMMPKVVEFPGPDWTQHPDLSKVDEVGFTDLSIGPGHGTQAPSSRLAWLEVYGKPVPR